MGSDEALSTTPGVAERLEPAMTTRETELPISEEPHAERVPAPCAVREAQRVQAVLLGQAAGARRGRETPPPRSQQGSYIFMAASAYVMALRKAPSTRNTAVIPLERVRRSPSEASRLAPKRPAEFHDLIAEAPPRATNQTVKAAVRAAPEPHSQVPHRPLATDAGRRAVAPRRRRRHHPTRPGVDTRCSVRCPTADHLVA